jgi:hypothetical protein
MSLAVTSRRQNRFYCFLGLPDSSEAVPFDYDRAVLSPYIRPVYLGLIRVVIGIYMLTSFIVYFLILASQKNKFLKKQAWKLLGDIAMLSFLGLTAYFFVAGYHTLTYSLKKRSPLDRWPRPFQLAHLILQTTVLVLPLFSTIIYVSWTIPAQRGWHTRPLTRWSTITFYMLNSVFSYLEMGLCSSRIRPWSHILVIWLLLGLYLAFHSLLVWATNGKVWIYTVLKYSLPINKGWISAVRVLGLCGLSLGCFCVMQLVLWIKGRYLGGVRLPEREIELTELPKLEIRSDTNEMIV